MTTPSQPQTLKPFLAVVGVGMVGGPLARYFSELKGYERGKDLFLYDIDPHKALSDDVNKADIVFISVPTPRSPSGEHHLGAVESAVKMIRGEKIVVLKSTMPPGTTARLQKEYPQHRFLFNPEFLTAAQAWEDTIRPDRQIVGFTEKSMDAAKMVLSLLPKAPFMSPWGSGYKTYMLTATEAELVKIFGNAFFSVKVIYANAVADATRASGANYDAVRSALSADYRIGESHMDVTHGNYRGFGGMCLPKDLSSLIAVLKELNVDGKIFEAAWKSNEELLTSQGLSWEDVMKGKLVGPGEKS